MHRSRIDELCVQHAAAQFQSRQQANMCSAAGQALSCSNILLIHHMEEEEFHYVHTASKGL